MNLGQNRKIGDEYTFVLSLRYDDSFHHQFSCCGLLWIIQLDIIVLTVEHINLQKNAISLMGFISPCYCIFSQ